MKKFNLGIILVLIMINILFFSYNSDAATLSPELRQEQILQDGTFGSQAGFNLSASVGNIVATVIKGFLSVLGVIFIIILVMAGYKYMTARGNEEKTSEAISSITRAIYGLIIVVSAYAITYFVFNAIDWMGN